MLKMETNSCFEINSLTIKVDLELLVIVSRLKGIKIIVKKLALGDSSFPAIGTKHFKSISIEDKDKYNWLRDQGAKYYCLLNSRS